MQIIRYEELRPAPWRNGGGITREALRRPAAGEFHWRLSFAEIAASGPFSDFAGYHRVMVLLAGRGLRLRVEGRETHVLRDAGEIIEFPGALRVACELIDGPCVDLNLMVRDSLPRPAVRVTRVPARLSSNRLRLVVAMEANLALRVPRLGREAPWHLAPWDTALLAPADGEVHIEAAPGSREAVAPRALVAELADD